MMQAEHTHTATPFTQNFSDYYKTWCGWGDSNSHASRHELLRLAWLPLHHIRKLTWCLWPDSNQPHTDFQSVALPDELQRQKWWVLTGSNRRHLRCKRNALPTELRTLNTNYGRSTRIRTLDLIVPNDANYRAVLHSEKLILLLAL